MESFTDLDHRAVSELFVPQVVVQVFIAIITVGFIVDFTGEQRGYGLYRLLSGQVVVEIAVDERIFLQVHQRLFQVVYGVHHEMVTGGFDAYCPVSGLPQSHVG